MNRRQRGHRSRDMKTAGAVPMLGAIALACLAMGAPPARAAPNTGCAGSPTANCDDVGADGIRYTSGVSTVNVRDGVAGTAEVIAGTAGIALSRGGVSGAVAPSVAFQTVQWDTDGNAATATVAVLSLDGSTPHKVGDQYVVVKTVKSNGDPETFGIGTSTYTGPQLAQYLAAGSPGAGGGAAIAGSLTVNNNAGPADAGAPFRTTDAPGIAVSSTGGDGGSGGCYSVLLLYSWCSAASGGGDAGSVAVNSNAAITVRGTAPGQHAISAISQGGVGGDGGSFVGAVSEAGAGGNGGSASLVSVVLGPQSFLTTNGDKSHGVYAQSRGGNGGHGGDPAGIGELGAAGGNGGSAGGVLVVNQGGIRTTGWNSHGIYARSVGAGAGSGSSADGIYAEGGDGGGESRGSAVTVNNSGSIVTEQSDSYGLLAQSIGGGGGDGGGAGGWFTVGGRGGSGGGSGVVQVFTSGKVQTGSALGGDRSTAIFAQSIGGGGGNGGDAVSASPVVSVAVGGSAGPGGAGNNVTVIADGSDIDTSGNSAHGIHAQSIGGGGGNGGVAVSGKLPGATPFNVSIALGGSGGDGGSAGELVRVETTAGTTIDTLGNSAYGILAQSIGGGGGNGSTALAGSGGPGLSVAVSIGGKGGVAGAGKEVSIDNAATITTQGDLSAGIFTQSIGGGGGNGGFAGSLAVGGASASVSLGGSGGSGGAGGKVGVVNAGTIDTRGQGAAGIFAQSIGGGGGNGGSALAGSIGLASVTTTVGGRGGTGNDGGLVDILNTGLITTRGNHSAGVYAQSVGGGGGSGGDATSLSLAGPVAVAVAVGGGGGTGGDGGTVKVDNQGRIVTEGPNSDGVFAQSIGGSGGAGGSATTGTLVFPVEIEGVEIPAIEANVAVGGRGAGGGMAGTVNVTNHGQIDTTAFLSNGVFAQSVGGSGGRGGHATNIAIAYDAMFTGKVAVGGSGADGGTGNTVTVDNFGQIHTRGAFSSGVLAQSVGGGGGVGGNATNISLSLTPPPTAPSDFIPSPSAKYDISVGGNGGNGAIGGAVTVTNAGSIVTEGLFATGVMAQSVGGAGGIGGDARSIQVELTADPMDFLPLTSLAGLDLTMVFGGSGGSGSHGGAVIVNHGSAESAARITTTGAFAHGIVAQSVGGGGGSGGSAMSFSFSNADIVPAIPVLDDISGLTTLEMTLQGSGGAGGNGGAVTVESYGDIDTSGHFAMGIVAQSVAGGGGLAGFFNPQGITRNEIVNALFNAAVDTEAGLSFAGSAGGAGNAGDVLVNHTGTIRTRGDGAHGLFAQSVAGQGVAGSVTVTLDGSIAATGQDAHGIYAQSGGAAGNGAIGITIGAGGSVIGGTGTGAGVVLVGGSANSLVNRGAIGSMAGVQGRAIVGGSGNDTVDNHGTVIGAVDLGGGANAFNNHAGSLLNAGATLQLGVGNTLSNAGALSPGGIGTVQTTALSGNYTQLGTGSFVADVDLGNGEADHLDLSGTAQLAGTLQVNLVAGGSARPGAGQVNLLAGAGGVDIAGLTLQAPTSAVATFSLLSINPNEVALDYKVDFSPAGLNANRARMGQYVNAIQRAGGSSEFAPIASSLLQAPDLAALGTAYDQLSPEPLLATAATAVRTEQRFADALHSCGVRGGEFRFVTQGDCRWVRLGASKLHQDATGTNLGFTQRTTTLAAGTQKNIDARWSAGFGFSIDTSTVHAGGNTRSEGTQVAAGAVAKRTEGAAVFTGSLAVGSGHYDTERRVGQAVASSDHDLTTIAAHARGSWTFEQDRIGYLRPFVDVGISLVYHRAFREQGADGANISARSGRDTHVSLQPGLEFGREFATADGTLLRPYGRVGITHFTAGTASVTASLQGAPVGTAPFVTENRMNRTFGDLALGLDVLRANGTVFRLGYAGQFSSRSKDHNATLKVAVPF